jgi:hypothetical protein
MKRTTCKAIGLIMPLANYAERERMSKLVDDRPATAGVHFIVSTMEPAYRAGDVLLIRPSDTAESGPDYLFRQKRTKRYVLLRVSRVTPLFIFGRQFNPAKIRRLPRKVWEPAYKVTGKYNRDPSDDWEQVPASRLTAGGAQ